MFLLALHVSDEPPVHHQEHCLLTLTLLTWTIWRAPTNTFKWRMGFNSAFKGFGCITQLLRVCRKDFLQPFDVFLIESQMVYLAGDDGKLHRSSSVLPVH
jgi:hypothetical protein